MSLHSHGCPGTHPGDQAELHLGEPVASVCLVLGLKADPPRPALHTGVFVCLIVVLGFVVVVLVIVCCLFVSFFLIT